MSFKPTKRQALIAVGYVVFMAVFLFIGMPKYPFKTVAALFLVVSAVYAAAVWFILKFLVKP